MGVCCADSVGGEWISRRCATPARQRRITRRRHAAGLQRRRPHRHRSLSEHRAACVAEARKVPLVCLYYAPMRPTGAYPNMLITTGRLPRRRNLATHSLFQRMCWRSTAQDINNFRASLGLAPVTTATATRLAASRTLELQAYHSALVPDLADYPTPVEIGWADPDPTGLDPGHLGRGPAQDAGSLAARQLRADPGLPKLTGQLPFPDRRCRAGSSSSAPERLWSRDNRTSRVRGVLQYCNHPSIVGVMAVTIGAGIADDTPPYRRRRGDRNDVTPPLPVRRSLKVGCRRITAGPRSLHNEFPALGRLIYQRLAAQSRTTVAIPKYVDDRRYPGGSQRPLHEQEIHRPRGGT